MAHLDEFNDDQDLLQIDEEYKIWKENVPFLYDMMVTHELSWPSLTIQWLPDAVQVDDENCEIHKLIIGTQTSNQDLNYLMLASVKLPSQNTLIDLSEYNQNNLGIGGLGISSSKSRIQIECQMMHQDDVNRARYMPQQQNIIATKTTCGDVHIFDSSNPESNQVSPILKLQGHTEEGYGISWNPKKRGYLLSGGFDNKIYIWDIESGQPSSAILENQYHQAPVEDVCWHKYNENIFGAVSDDQSATIWDIRKPQSYSQKIQAHAADIFSMDFNNRNEYLFLTSSADQTVVLWDMRKTEKKIHSFESHSHDILKVEWSPNHGNIFASSSADRRCMVWDLENIGKEQTTEDAQDGPPELLFAHGGHRSRITDFSWNFTQQMLLASVEDENILQIWQMSENTYFEGEEMDLENE